jgi:hypothetical protein
LDRGDQQGSYLDALSRSASSSWLDEPSFQPHHTPFIKNLGTLGIEANLRIVDPVQHLIACAVLAGVGDD